MRKLLIDADVVAYRAASSVEQAVEFEPGYWTWYCDEQLVRDAVDTQIETFMVSLKADACVLCLTDSERNFRLDILPSYKGNRTGVKKPLVLKAIKAWMVEERGAYLKPRLEGDDCMGILATMKNPDREERIIVSVDKDMKTIPGKFSKDGKTITTVSQVEADYWHLFQTLTGDTTDGYKGCPGVGPKKAEEILSEVKGFQAASLWPAVVAAFEKAGLTEEDALVQARVARILRASDYDFKNKEPKLWSPA